MAFTTSLIYNQNAFERDNTGDLTLAVFEMTALAADVYPGAAGEPVDFSAVFRQVFHVAFGIQSARPGGGAWPAQIFVPQYDPVAANTGVVRFFVDGAGAGAVLNNYANAAYGFDFRIRCVVVGRPATDAG